MRKHRTLWILIAAATAIRVALAAIVPLLPDETYYWDWSRHLAAGYFDHPPAVAFLIRAGTLLAGVSPLGARVWMVVCGIVATLAISWTAARIANTGDAEAPRRAGERAAMLVLVIPAGLLGFVLATPDAPLLAAVALVLAAVVRALEAKSARESLEAWSAAGLATGVALCAKYTAVLIPAAVFVALLLRADLRRKLAEPGPYLAVAIALVIFAPTVVWNAHHAWVSFAFQLNHGLGASHGSVLGRELNLVGGQLGLVTPILAILAAASVARACRRASDARAFVLATVAIVISLFFVLSATRRPVEPNWPFLAFVAAVPLLATARRVDGDRWFTAGVALAATCTAIVSLHAATGLLPIPTRRDPLARTRGWADLARAVSAASARESGCAGVWIAADRYQEASELAFHLPGRPRVFSLNLGGRRNQYDLWPNIYDVASGEDCAIVVTDMGKSGADVIAKLGASRVDSIGVAHMRWRATTIGDRMLWIVRGIPAAPAGNLELSSAQRADLDSLLAGFTVRAASLDSIVATFRRGAAPYLVSLSRADAPASIDRKKVVDARITSVRDMLKRTGATAVYRDARYPACTFVRVGLRDSTVAGYVHAPEGCSLAATGDARIFIRPLAGNWRVFAAP